ncbi:MAG: outer membrane protein assembly factor BamE [Antarcticimicrobium sp.]|uniref:outer membrane protein assembly factor BamE n=1 Tax=Antarcticimicrobium sp. TaxID=2824147 RepID=UPI002607576D|nr:outer membrane protein assembly factor BamE [Antarcticimicrobium sp.]MDF1717207.1 outer membrane protein assembly factor BamE [Antarcticimicrobium sp.]
MKAYVTPLKAILRGAGLALVLVAVSGCVAIYRNHGYVPTPEELDAIQVGKDTRDSVTEAVGPPSSSGVLKDSGFYYVASRMRHYGAAAPKLVSREVVAITFDQRGVVRGIERYGLEDGRTIPLQRRVTSSSVEDKTFLRQLLGNLGRFNPGNVLEN